MTGATSFAPQGHDLAFEDVSFSYNTGEQVLSGVTFTAREGEVTALVGPSGVGQVHGGEAGGALLGRRQRGA